MTVIRRRTLLGVTVSMLAASGAAASRPLRALNAFPPNFVFTREIAAPFFDAVTRASQGAL